LLFLTFFLLEQKEPKIQDKPDPSGRFVGPFRTSAVTYRFILYTLTSAVRGLQPIFWPSNF
jgi:hypothetical protein